MKTLTLHWAMPKPMDQTDDDRVVEKILEGRTDAFEILVSRYEGYVFRLVRGHVPAPDVEDTAQEAFLRAFRSLGTYKGRGKGFRAWLGSVTVRTCYDYWRKAYRNREVPVSHLTEDHEKWLDSVLAGQSTREEEDREAAARTREILEAALARLSPEDRMVVDLVYLQGYTGREAAELLGWTTANVKVRSFRARKKLEAFLLKTGRIEGR